MSPSPFFRSRTLCAGVLVLAAGLSAPVRAQEPANLEDVTVDAYQQLTAVLVQFVADQLANLPSGDNSPRENGYGILAGVWGVAGTGMIALPAAGLAIGGGLGAAIGAPAAGAGAAPGAGIGAGIGTGTGIVAGFAGMMTAAVITANMIDTLEEKYPPPAAGAGAARMMLPGSAGHGSAASAGPLESTFILMVCSLPDEVLVLADKWDRMPGLNSDLQRWLRKVSFVRPSIERVAYIKRNQRVGPNTPRAANLLQQVEEWITFPEHAAVEKWWVDALGIGGFKASLKSGQLDLDTPPFLRTVGAPADVKVPVAGVDFKLGGNGGAMDPYVRFKYTPGPFHIDWGTATVVKSGAHKDRIRVTYSVGKNASVGKAEVRWRWNSPENTAAAFHPKLGSTMSGSMFFRVEGLGAVVDSVTVGGVNLALNLPKELTDLAGLGDLIKSLGAKASDEIEKLLGKALPWGKADAAFKTFPAKSLAHGLDRIPMQHGYTQVKSVEALALQAGRLKARVKAVKIGAPPLPRAQAKLAQDFNALLKSPIGSIRGRTRDLPKVRELPKVGGSLRKAGGK